MPVKNTSLNWLQTVAKNNLLTTLQKQFTPFLVMGPSKSGTTWLQKLIDSHDKIRCHFQLPIFPISNLAPVLFPSENIRKPLFEPAKVVYNQRVSPYKGIFKTEAREQEYLIRSQYFSKLQQTSFISKQELSEQFSGKAHEEYIDKLFLDFNKNLAQIYLPDKPDKLIYGTKCYADLEKFFEAYPNAKVVSIFRDGRDVAVSKRFHLYRMGAYYLGDEKSMILNLVHQSKFGRRISKYLSRKTTLINRSSFYSFREGRRLFSNEALKKIIGDWRNVAEYILSWQRERPSQFFIIRYEDLKSDPISVVASIFQFLGIPTSTEQIMNIVDRNNFTKKKKGENSFFRKGVAGDWKNFFTPKDIAITKRLTKDVLIQLGYEKDQSW